MPFSGLSKKGNIQEQTVTLMKVISKVRFHSIFYFFQEKKNIISTYYGIIIKKNTHYK